MNRIKWPELMRAGLHRLALPPETFWSLTPAELQLMLGEQKSSGPMLMAGLDALMNAYPDETEETQNDG